MTIGKSKNKISRIVETSFAPKTKENLSFFLIEKKPVEIMFEKTTDNIKIG